MRSLRTKLLYEFRRKRVYPELGTVVFWAAVAAVWGIIAVASYTQNRDAASVREAEISRCVVSGSLDTGEPTVRLDEDGDWQLVDDVFVEEMPDAMRELCGAAIDRRDKAPVDYRDDPRDDCLHAPFPYGDC